MKRFWKEVAVVASGDGYVIVLDGKPMHTPAQQTYVLRTKGLAEAIAAEWNAVKEIVVPADMPVTQLAATVIDIVPRERANIINQLASYATTDMLCYRAEHPPALVSRQQESWQPLLDWAALNYDALMLVTHGVKPVTQTPDALAALRRAIEKQDDYHLAALQVATTATGSVIVGLALLEQKISPDEAYAAAELDSEFQAESWGSDEEAAARRRGIHADIKAADLFAKLSTT